MSAEKTPLRLSKTGWLMTLMVGLVLMVQAAMVFGGLSPLLKDEMPDSDTYMRLVRVEDWLQGQGWFDSSVARMNAPYGDVLNWTRPLDVLIFITALPFYEYADLSLHQALFWGGALLPVLLHLALGFALLWAFRPLLPKNYALLPLLFLWPLLQPVMLAYNMAGRPDHQTLLLISVVMMMGSLWREQMRHGRPMVWAMIAGLWAGFGQWLSSEMQFPLIVFSGILTLCWLHSGDKAQRNALEGLAIGFFVSVGLAMLCERGGAWSTVRELDKISLSQFLGAAVNCALWGSLSVWRIERRFVRILLFAFYALLAAGAITFLAPELWRGPSGDIDPRALHEFLLQTREMRPLWPTDQQSAGFMLVWIGTPLCALLLWLRWGSRSLYWQQAAAMTLAFTLAALLHARMAQYAAPLGAVLLVLMMGEHIRLQSFLPRMMARAGLLGLPLLLGLVLVPASSETQLAIRAQPCDVHQAAAALSALPRGIIMAHLNYGAELLYRTPHAVVAGSYHRNARGIADSIDYYATGRMDILTARSIRYVLACAADAEREAENTDFLKKLVSGAKIDNLERIEEGNFGGFLVYRTKK